LPLPPRKKSFALIEAEGRKAIALPGHLLEEAFCQKLVADLFVINPGPCRKISHSSIWNVTEEELRKPGKASDYHRVGDCEIYFYNA